MKKALSIKRLAISFRYAFTGFKKSFKAEANMKIHIMMAILVILCGFISKVNKQEWICLIFAIGLVISAELLNTAIENIVDLITTEKNEKAAFIKDVSAAFVLILAMSSAVIGLIIFIPKLLILLGLM